MLQRHRQVNTTLQEEYANGLHALSIEVSIWTFATICVLWQSGVYIYNLFGTPAWRIQTKHSTRNPDSFCVCLDQNFQLATRRKLERYVSLLYSAIDDSTPVSQSRHTLRFQPIACRSIMRCPRVLTRPEMVWQAFVPDIASGQLAVFDMAENNNRKTELLLWPV